MIDITKVLQALEKKKDKIKQEYVKFDDIPYNLYFKELEELSKEDFRQLGKDKVQAIPVEFKTGIIRNLAEFADINNSVQWAINQVLGTSLAAVDGSQIMPSKDISYPIAMVQAGYFTIKFATNFPDTCAEVNYDTYPEILISSDSIIYSSSSSSSSILREGDVSLKRQSLEISVAEELLEILKEYPDPLILLDGTIIYSYMANLNPKTRKNAIDELVKFLRAAEKQKIPVIGYIDSSYARDIAKTLLAINGKNTDQAISDAAFLDVTMKNLGDYTIPFICRRKPIEEYGIYENKICFSYMRVNSIRSVRLEFPFWIWKSEKYEHIMRRILAEVIISHGYPRILTRAHQVAVLTGQEREKFHKIVLKYFNDHLDIPVREMVKSKMKHKFS